MGHYGTSLWKSTRVEAACEGCQVMTDVNAMLKSQIEKTVGQLVNLTRDDGSPNINQLWMHLKELNAIKWSVKQSGYSIARTVFENVSAREVPKAPPSFLLKCKPSTQSDLETDWFVYWMNQLKCAPLPHRKLWEFSWFLQNLYALGLLAEGKRAIGFGCGEEPLPSYLASRGIEVTVTDLPLAEVKGKGWLETGQHTSDLRSAFKPYLVSEEVFQRRVSLEYVDMNDIPVHLDNRFDFCWSICALEHLGSLEKGLSFIRNSLCVLKEGGVAFHTTEFNYTESDVTIDNWPTVLFLRSHFQGLRESLTHDGHEVGELDFDVGCLALDNFIDLPPYDFDSFLRHDDVSNGNGFRPGHLKLSVDGFPSTCFGIWIRKKGSQRR
jgi:hypothetical protein